MACFFLDLFLGGLVFSDVTDAFYPYPKNNLASQPWTSSSLVGPEASLLSVTKDDNERPGWVCTPLAPGPREAVSTPRGAGKEPVHRLIRLKGWSTGSLLLLRRRPKGRGGTLANRLVKGLWAFFFKLMYLFLAVLGLQHRLLSSCRVRGAALQLQQTGFSLQRHLVAEDELAGSRAQAQQVWCTGPDALRHVGSSPTRD